MTGRGFSISFEFPDCGMGKIIVITVASSSVEIPHGNAHHKIHSWSPSQKVVTEINKVANPPRSFEFHVVLFCTGNSGFVKVIPQVLNLANGFSKTLFVSGIPA